MGSGSGSDLFLRIGISGDDAHNGGLLGSIQFLAGNRISQCVNVPILSSLSEDLNTKILIFNCILSLSGMLLISIVSILGFIFFVNEFKFQRTLLSENLITNSAFTRNIFFRAFPRLFPKKLLELIYIKILRN